ETSSPTSTTLRSPRMLTSEQVGPQRVGQLAAVAGAALLGERLAPLGEVVGLTREVLGQPLQLVGGVGVAPPAAVDGQLGEAERGGRRGLQPAEEFVAGRL